MRFRAALVISAMLAGCVAPAASKLAANDYRRIIADALDYHSDTAPYGRYEISQPWQNLPGAVVACVVSHPPDGKGGYFPASEFALYAVQDGKITNIIRPAPNCEYLTGFEPLLPSLRR